MRKRVWVGGFGADTQGHATGISVFDIRDEGLADGRIVASALSPAYLAQRDDVIYAVCEGTSALSSYRIEGEKLVNLSSIQVPGSIPCSVRVAGDVVAVACYGDGRVSIHPLDADGAAGPSAAEILPSGVADSRTGRVPRAHDILGWDADTILATDLGTDALYRLHWDGSTLDVVERLSLPPESGPRDLFRHPAGPTWVLTESGCRIHIFDDGLVDLGSVPLPGAESGDLAAAIALSADQRFVYAGLRGSDRIAVLSVSDDGRVLTPVTHVPCGARWPRHMVVDGAFLRVANQHDDSIATFAIDAGGIPRRIGETSVASPSFLLIDCRSE